MSGQNSHIKRTYETTKTVIEKFKQRYNDQQRLKTAQDMTEILSYDPEELGDMPRRTDTMETYNKIQNTTNSGLHQSFSYNKNYVFYY